MVKGHDSTHCLLNTPDSSCPPAARRRQIAREAHKRFGYDLFRSTGVEPGVSFEVRACVVVVDDDNDDCTELSRRT